MSKPAVYILVPAYLIIISSCLQACLSGGSHAPKVNADSLERIRQQNLADSLMLSYEDAFFLQERIKLYKMEEDYRQKQHLKDSVLVSQGINDWPPNENQGDDLYITQVYKLCKDSVFHFSILLPVEWNMERDELWDPHIYKSDTDWTEIISIHSFEGSLDSFMVYGLHLDKEGTLYFTGFYDTEFYHETGIKEYTDKKFAYSIRGDDWTGYCYLGYLEGPYGFLSANETLIFHKDNRNILFTSHAYLPIPILQKLAKSFKFLD